MKVVLTMTKKNILTMLGIILSFTIAIGGLALTSYLIGIKSDGLLSETLNVTTNTLENMSTSKVTPENYASMDSSSLSSPKLTEDEIVSILRNWSWKSANRETPHEPTEEQLNMEEAIVVAKEWLYFIDELNIFPTEWLYFNNVSAYLAQKLPSAQSNIFLPPAYSYWAVGFTNEAMSVSVTINAVTGQVWETMINVHQTDIDISGYNITNALVAFTSVFDINFEGSGALYSFHNEDGILTAFLNFADGNATAAVTANGWHLDDDRFKVGNLRMHLFTN